jgi:hypothetical protein
MSEDVEFSATGTYHFEIEAKGDLANDVGPEMELLIDGERMGSVFVNTTASAIFTFEIEVAAGWHEVAIGFNNDYYVSGEGIDRNLYVDKITILAPIGYTNTMVIEAEQMSYHANGAQEGDYWLLWSNGSMSEDVEFSATGTYHFEIEAKGDLANGVGPEMELLIDGQRMGSVFVNTTASAIITFEIEVAAGWHEVAIAFNNDYCDPASGTDRNLYVDKITISYQ